MRPRPSPRLRLPVPPDDLKARTVGHLSGHDGPTYAVAWTPDGARAITGGFDGSIRLWDPAARVATATWTGHAGMVLALAIDPSGRRLASGGLDKAIRVVDLPETSVRTASGFTGGVGGVVVEGVASAGRLSGAGGPVAKVFSGQGSQVYGLAWSTDGSRLASGGGDAAIRVWDASKGTQIRAIEKAHTQSIYAVAFHPTADLLISAGNDKLIKFWDLATGKEVRKVAGHAAEIYGLAHRPGCLEFATGSVDRTIKLWTLDETKEVRTFAGHPDEVYGIAFDRDGGRLASVGYSGWLFVWDVDSGKALLRERMPKGTLLHGVAWKATGPSLLLGGTGPGAILIDLT